MASIDKRTHASGSVTYRVRIRLNGTPTITESFPTRREAKEWASKMEAEVRQGRYFGIEERKERTFAELADRYLAQTNPSNPKSFHKCKIQILWWRERLRDYYLCRITPSMISQMKDDLLKEKTPKGNLRTQSTANRYIAALSCAFSLAVREWGWIKENPVSKISRFKEGKARERFLTKEEVEKLLEVCKERQKPSFVSGNLICSFFWRKKRRNFRSQMEGCGPRQKDSYI